MFPPGWDRSGEVKGQAEGAGVHSARFSWRQLGWLPEPPHPGSSHLPLSSSPRGAEVPSSPVSVPDLRAAGTDTQGQLRLSLRLRWSLWPDLLGQGWSTMWPLQLSPKDHPRAHGSCL